MALKFKHQTKAEIPVELQPLWVERDGAWVLDVKSGLNDKAKLEFRTANIALRKQAEDLTAQLGGIDPKEVPTLGEEKRKLEESQTTASGCRLWPTGWTLEPGSIKVNGTCISQR